MYSTTVKGSDVVRSIPSMLRPLPDEGIVGEVQTVKLDMLDAAHNVQLQDRESMLNGRHLQDLEEQAKAMSLDDQRATARGLDPRVMLDEIGRSMMEQNKKIQEIYKVIGQ